jgi:hypothetical protein
VDPNLIAKLVEHDERLAAIAVELLPAIPSPSGRRFAAAELLAL